jgi:radical SAM superfamily enzyme YgiQ (UPF0313 family)
MRVLLVKPQSNSDSIQPILGLGYLAAQLKKNQEVKILDCIKEKLPPSKFKRFIYDYNPEVVGIQSLTTDLKLVNDYLATIKKFNSNIITIIGGPHPSSAGAAALLDFPQADFAFQGEAEIGLPQLLTELEAQRSKLKGQGSPFTFHLSPLTRKEIPGLIYRSGNEIETNPPLFYDNLDDFGFPAWDLIQPQDYPPAPHGGFFRQFPVAPLNISRGCPCDCSFCSVNKISGKKIRYRNLESVIEEIRLLQNRHHVKEIHIIDDNFTWDRPFVLRFCDALIKNNLALSWTCPNGVRVDTLDRELLKAMKKAGCYSLSVGIESGSDHILQYLKKNISRDYIKSKIDLIKDARMDAIGFFILGFPSETKEDMLNTIQFSLALGLKRAQFILFHPFPGSEIYGQLNLPLENKNNHSSSSTYADPAFVPVGISIPELKNIQRSAFLKFYLRPKAFLSLIAGIKSMRHLLYLLKRIKRWLL